MNQQPVSYEFFLTLTTTDLSILSDTTTPTIESLGGLISSISSGSSIEGMEEASADNCLKVPALHNGNTVFDIWEVHSSLGSISQKASGLARKM